MTSPNLYPEFRPATVADIAAVTALEAAFYPTDGYPEPLFYQALHQWPQLFQVAATEQQVAAYILGAPAEQTAHLWLMSLLVSSDQRGKGLGAQLMEYWLSTAERLGYHSIWLTVAPQNSAAIKLYERFGFISQHLEHDYLGQGLDRLVMLRTSQALTETAI
ncbi:GNAT family N-acetyltransferase [Pseudidiomarina salilacus]|uniref:GNAT family N-acetyltransferase n=1 Tax=Pseudidiomarina salilacus TaxID=3384452 RepID=UPI0039846405